MRRLILSTAVAALLAAPALAEPITVQASADFQEELQEEYGERELERLAEEVREDITREFTKSGITASRIDVTILDAKPNRPTFEQLGGGLSAQSFGVGGMDLKAVAYSADDAVLGELEYGWFSRDIHFARGNSTWSDARRASSKFARKFAKQLAG